MRIRTLLAASAALAAVAAAPTAVQANATDPQPVAAASAQQAGAAGPTARAAHTEVVRRTPGPGTTASNVKAVGIVFSQRLVTGKLDIYRGSTKLTPRSSGPDGSRVRATFARKLAAGGYTVRWRAVATDGHTQTGSWSFRVR